MIDPLSTSSSLCSEEEKRIVSLRLSPASPWIFSCLLVYSVCFHQGCLLFFIFCQVFLFFLTASLCLLFPPTCCLVCLVFVWQASFCVFLHICCDGLWPLISPATFSPGIFRPSLVNFSFLFQFLYICLPHLLPAAMLSQSSPCLLYFSVTPLVPPLI